MRFRGSEFLLEIVTGVFSPSPSTACVLSWDIWLHMAQPM
jgi:hypothetical protein